MRLQLIKHFIVLFFMKFQMGNYFVIFLSKVIQCLKWASITLAHEFKVYFISYLYVYVYE